MTIENDEPVELTPGEIRRIREKLGLSQVEAGELLGGGPRAFTKYEAGTIRPSASIANMLRLLDANSYSRSIASEHNSKFLICSKRERVQPLLPELRRGAI